MKIKKVTLEDFSAFQHAEFNFSPGINVFIGANATGKTHLLKLLYSVCASSPKRTESADAERFARKLRSKLSNVFKPDSDDLAKLIREGETHARVTIQYDRANVSFEIDQSGTLNLREMNFKDNIRSVFIPSKEMLSIYPGFIASYNEKEIPFDETYYDICVALGGSSLRSAGSDHVSLVKELQKVLEGKVVFSGKDFHIQAHGQPNGIEAHLLSEGMRKIAIVARLLETGAIRRDGIVFWDEPESSLNPKLVTQVARIIRRLAAMNVQVFLATHDYLLTRVFSLAVEYGEKPKAKTSFYGFNRADPLSPICIDEGAKLSDLQQNPILEEFIENYEHEQRLFTGKD